MRKEVWCVGSLDMDAMALKRFFANKHGGRTDEFLEDFRWFLVYLEVGKRIGKLHFPEETSSSNH